MSKEHKLEFNDNYIVVEEPHENDKGVVVLGKTDDCSLHILYESYNATHIDFFIKLIKYVAALQTKLAEQQECSLKASSKHNLEMQNAQICVKELETKLAESEKENNELKDKLKWIKEEVEENFVDGQKYDQLKHQLAEKEKEIDNLYNRLNSKQKFYEMGLEKDYKEYLSRLNKIEKRQDKDKISFCIEKLEKVKEWLEPKYFDYEQINYLTKIIDNQIKQLKGGKL